MSTTSPVDDSPNRVFIKNLYMGVTEDRLSNALQHAGLSDGLLLVRLIKRGRFDPDRSINGFLTYETKEQVQDVILKLNGLS